jgi:hypothetical protein
VVIAGLGDYPDTIEDRSIRIEMKPRRHDEELEGFRRRVVAPQAAGLRERIVAWVEDHANELTNYYPKMPDGIADRAADVWEPIVILADKCGPNLAMEAREAAMELQQGARSAPAQHPIQLLEDLWVLFSEDDSDFMTTKKIVDRLASDHPDRWQGLLTPRRLAGLLRPFNARPTDRRVGTQTLKCYLRADFVDAWSRYLKRGAPTATAAITVDLSPGESPRLPEKRKRPDPRPNRKIRRRRLPEKNRDGVV